MCVIITSGSLRNEQQEDVIEKIFIMPTKSHFLRRITKKLESGVESWKVDAVRALRDAIPSKPRKYSWLIREWAEKVSVLLDMSVSVLENKWTAEEFTNEL